MLFYLFILNLEKAKSQCLSLKENFNGYFESKWIIKKTKPGCFWEYENDPSDDLSIKYIDLNINFPSQSPENTLINPNFEDLSSMIIRKEFFCKNGVIKFKFMSIGTILEKKALLLNNLGGNNGLFGFLFRYRDDENFLSFEISPKRNLRRVTRVLKGQKTILFQLIDQNAFAFKEKELI